MRAFYMKKSAVTLICLLTITAPAFADFKEHFDLGQQYLANYQYSGAVTEFKNALRINYLKRIGRKPRMITEVHYFTCNITLMKIR